MNLPNYTIIHITSSKEEYIHQELSKVEFQQYPIVFNLLGLKEHQLSVIVQIENYLDINNIFTMPYGVYIISDCIDYGGKLTICPEPGLLPQFYKQKTKNLNNKENNLLKKINMKRESYRSLQRKDYLRAIQQYAKGHRALYHVFQECNYYERLLEQIKGEK